MIQLYDAGREGFLDGTIDFDTDDIRAMLVLSTYTFSAAHKFLADLGAVDNGRSAALGTKTVASGVAGAADSSLVATAASASKAFVLFKHTGSDATARVISYHDGIQRVVMAADAASSATTIWFEALIGALANGVVLSLVSGTGPATVTLTAGAAAGARTVTVSALASNIVAGAIYTGAVTASGLPFTPAAGQTVNIAFDTGANKIFKL
jgi:hypothetical protein